MLVTIEATPAAGLANKGLVRDIGHFVWRRYATVQIVDQLKVVFLENGKESSVHDLPAPPMARRMRRPPPTARKIPVPGSKPPASPPR